MRSSTYLAAMGFVALVGGCATNDGDAGQPDPGSDPGSPADETTLVTTYHALSNFHSDFGSDPGVAGAIGVLLRLTANPAGTVGDWMTSAAPASATEIHAAVAAVLTDSPYLADTGKLDELTTERAYHTFLLYQDLELHAKGDKRWLRDAVVGVIVWDQVIADGISDSWSSSFPLVTPIATDNIGYRLDANTLTIDQHAVSVPLSAIVRGMAGDNFEQMLSFIVECDIIANHVSERVGIAAPSLAAACSAGVTGMAAEFDAAVAAIDGHVDFHIAADITTTNDAIESGHWTGFFESAWNGQTPLEQATIANRGI